MAVFRVDRVSEVEDEDSCEVEVALVDPVACRFGSSPLRDRPIAMLVDFFRFLDGKLGLLGTTLLVEASSTKLFLSCSAADTDVSSVDDALADFVEGLANLTPLDFPTGRKPGLFFFIVLARGTSGATVISLDIVAMEFVLSSIQVAFFAFTELFDLCGVSRHVGWPWAVRWPCVGGGRSLPMFAEMETVLRAHGKSTSRNARQKFPGYDLTL
jgi:hypothetical protein